MKDLFPHISNSGKENKFKKSQGVEGKEKMSDNLMLIQIFSSQEIS